MKTAPPDGSKHRVLDIIDGDTIDIDTAAGELRVRIIGIDTPETVDPGKPVEPGGPEATARARQLLAGKTVTIHYDPNPDHGKWGKYGRLLAYIEMPDGRDYGLVMIQVGLSKAYIKYPFSRMLAYSRAEQKTNQHKNRKRGSDMLFGKDLWAALRFLIELLKLIIGMFGDDEDKANAKQNNIKV